MKKSIFMAHNEGISPHKLHKFDDHEERNQEL